MVLQPRNGGLTDPELDRWFPHQDQEQDQCGQATKGMWGMSWRQKAKGRGRLRKVRGSCQTSFDPGIPELTQGTETSHYLEEEKETSIPLVAASESGTAQTSGTRPVGVVGPVFRLLVP